MAKRTLGSRVVEPDLHNRVAPEQFLSLFSDQLIIAAGTIGAGTRLVGAGLLQQGLKVVVVLSGREKVQVQGHKQVEVSASQSLLIINRHDTNTVQWTAIDVPLRFVVVHVAPSLAQKELGISLPTMMAKDDKTPLFQVYHDRPALESLASQIVSCPMQGARRRLYLAGKAFELLASAIEPILGQPGDAESSPRDIKRVHEAHDRLLNAIDNPPSLDELARAVGLSTSKLTLEFRRAFGTTVFGVLQEHRLQQAYGLLANGEKTVSEAAFSVGYSPAHFATIFRQRFGTSPSRLRRSKG